MNPTNRIPVARHMAPIGMIAAFSVATLSSSPLLATADVPTYSEHIAPILRGHCESCHRAGQIGPMSLVSYQDTRPWAKAIVRQVTARAMPPYFAHPDSRKMKGDLNLTDQQIQMLVAWVQNGAPEGDPDKAPPPRQYTTFAGGWQLGVPDLVLQPSAPYLVGKTVDDEYRCYAIDWAAKNDLWIKGVEFQAGNAQVVHHFILFADPTGHTKALDDATAEAGWECGQMDGDLVRAKILKMWAPGNLQPFSPNGVGTRLPAHSQMILQVHYHNVSGVDLMDRSTFAIHLAKPEETIDKEIRGQLVSAWTLDIPAGEPYVEHRASYTAGEDITVYTAGGHMHYRGKDIGMWATKPEGPRETLLWMPNYDFNWQLTYEYEVPLKAPKGTTFEMISHHDNSINNPNNPDPTKHVKWGLATSDEMSFTGFGYTLDSEHLGITPELPLVEEPVGTAPTAAGAGAGN